MFEVEKPRRFHYQPRFYDPEKEKWEALKKKYAMEKEYEEARRQRLEQQEGAGQDGEPSDIEYFEQRVRDLDRQERTAASHLTWRDLFRKREMPKFNYQPRFSASRVAQPPVEADTQKTDEQSDVDAVVDKYRQSKHQIKIRRRFDISDPDYLKPISGTKIILYCFIVFLLLTLIIAF